MILVLLILIPLVAGILCFLIKPAAKHLALATASGLMGLGIGAATAAHSGSLTFSMPWMPHIGASFSLLGDGLSTMLTMLSGIVMLAVMLMQMNKEVESPHSFY